MRGAHGPEVAAALLVDAVLGEPPERLHPTVWMGQAVWAVEDPALRIGGARGRRLAGVLLATVLPAAAFLSSRAVLRATPRGLRPIAEVALLSTTLSMRGLAAAAAGVRRELAAGDAARARRLVGTFVGRDTEDLPEAGICRAAVESVAENTSDGVVAPMLYGYLFGAPGALAYKAINTVDSMVGHRSPRHEDLGLAGARLDDLANLVPARLTVLACALVSADPAAVLRSAMRYGPLTASPNAGHVEAAFAGALGLRLGGTNSYGGVARPGPVLGEGSQPGRADIRRAVALMRRVCALLVLLLAVDR